MLFYEQVSLRTCITDSKLSPTHVILFHLFPIYSCSLLEISLPIISESTAKFWIKPESVTSNARLTPFSLFVLEHFLFVFGEEAVQLCYKIAGVHNSHYTWEWKKWDRYVWACVFWAQRLGVGIRHIWSMNTGLKYIPSILPHRFPLIMMGAEAVLSSIHWHLGKWIPHLILVINPVTVFTGSARSCFTNYEALGKHIKYLLEHLVAPASHSNGMKGLCGTSR